jgi:Ca-activated chloride channel homolog
MSFDAPRWLWLLAAVPPLLALEWRAARRGERALERLVGARREHALLEQRLPGQRRMGALLRSGALALLVIGAAGPQWGRELVRRSASGSDVALVIDVSASMDARDVPPSRLEEARREAVAVLDHLQGSRVGVVAFAGDAVRLCPLTLDRSAARLVLESLSSGTVSQPGSDLGRGLRTAARLLPGRRRSEQAIVLWTDGEDLEQGARTAMDELARAGLRVFAVGVGTPEGDVVPVLDEQDRAVDVKRDDSGAAVRSRLDETLLRGLARRTQGAYFAASRPGGELSRLLATLGTLARGERGERLVERPVPRFPLFALAAAAALALDLVRRRRRGGTTSALPSSRPSRPAARSAAETGPGRIAAAGLAFAIALVATAPPAMAQSAWARGDRAFAQGRWAAAESLYAIRAARRASPAVQVNLATARARAGNVAGAEDALRRASAARGPAGQTGSYNLGTLQAERGAYDDALASLRQALERDPADDEARWNYEWTLRRKQERRRNPQAPPRPQPQQPQPQQGGQGQPQPSPSQQAPAPQQAGENPPQPQPRGGMDRRQAEQLLGSLQELERLEQQRLRQMRVMRERRGRDW